MNSENRGLIEGELEAVSGGADPLKLLATVSVLQAQDANQLSDAARSSGGPIMAGWNIKSNIRA